MRAELGLSQEALARLLAVSFASVNRYESGDHPLPSGLVMDVCEALQAALKKNKATAILGGDDEPRGPKLARIFRIAYGEKRRARRT